jgi:hypothetical protein
LIATSLLGAYSAWAIYRLDRAGWWVTFTSVLAMAASWLVSLAQIDPKAMYQLMGHTPEAIARMNELVFATNAVVAATWSFLLGLLLFVKRHYRAKT